MIWDCVVDASVAIKLYVEEGESSDNAVNLLDIPLRFEPFPRFLVPAELFALECIHGLMKYTRKPEYGYSLDKVRAAEESLRNRKFERIPISPLVQQAIELVIRFGIRSYDAVYIALAQEEGLPFVTADEKLLRQLGPQISSALDVRELESFVKTQHTIDRDELEEVD